ncbi:MAG: zinc ABC transporter substrate-binding protein [Planctomycetota bacterium]
MRRGLLTVMCLRVPAPLTLAGAVLGLGIVAGCAREERSGKPVVAVSVVPQEFFVRQIAGDLVDVEVMIPPGASPHTFEPTMSQMKAVARAVLYVKVGHPHFSFETAWLNGLLKENPSTKVVDGSQGMTQMEGDPHVWVAPSCVRVTARNIARALIEIMPAQRGLLEANLQRFLQGIDELDAEIRQALQPYAGRSFFVFHPAWGYFAQEYGLVQVAIEHEHKEPTQDHLREVIEQAKAQQARVIFVQPQFSRMSAELVAHEISGSAVAIDNLAYDWLDNLRRVTAALVEAFEK